MTASALNRVPPLGSSLDERFGDFVIRCGLVRPVINAARDFRDQKNAI